jgi:hypothetical protein
MTGFTWHRAKLFATQTRILSFALKMSVSETFNEHHAVPRRGMTP